ncbi:MAG: RHS domain-containing protein [Desulfuromonadales bacterium]|nr:RHS domain-containing protein [Desulfuromonadales bacterium]
MNKFVQYLIGILLAFCLLATQSALAETVYYYHTDPAGTPLAITNQYGVKAWEADYLPFGEVYSESGTANDRKFVGKERDEESNLDYFGARYHYAKIGRFLAPDPVRAVSPQTGQVNAKILKNPQRHNRYSYSLNNSYRNVDLDGRIPIDTIWDIGNIVYDIATGDKVGLAADTAALAIPYVPAGLSKVGKVAKVANITDNTANSAVDALKLKKSLASESQMRGAGRIIAGAGGPKPFRDATRVSEQYGGGPSDWVKKSSSSYTAPDGAKFETHWVESITSGQRVEHKTKINGAD